MLMKSVALCASLTLSAVALAGAPKQNHHCTMADGTTDATKTHKQCTAAKGKWMKDEAPAPTDMPANAGGAHDKNGPSTAPSTPTPTGK